MSEEKVKLERALTCTSCGIRLEGTIFASFPCPNCGEVSMGRCKVCKNQTIPYVCQECGFQGP